MPKKILIIEDDKILAELLEKKLKNTGFEVSSAVDGEAGLKSLRANKPDLILLDIVMPDMDGYETVEMMRQEERTMYLPVIFVSAIYKDDFYVIKGMETGAVDFISKPIIPETRRIPNSNVLEFNE